jgi:hypothetical protein
MSRPGVTSRDKSGSDAGEGWRRRLSLVVSVACFTVSAAGAVACFVICLVSSVPVPPVPVVIWASLFGGLFPLNLLGLLWNGRSRLTPNRWLMAAFALAVICFVSGFVQLSVAHGQPEVIHGAYYTDTHGTLTRVSHDTYLWAARAAARMFSGGACLFYVVAAVSYSDRWLDLRYVPAAISRSNRRTR